MNYFTDSNVQPRHLARFLVNCLAVIVIAAVAYTDVAVGQDTSPTNAVAQDTAAENTAAENVDPETVVHTLEKFRSRSFRVRQDAEDALWRMGPSIEPVLINAFDNTDDLEVRDRIASLRFKFQLGLTPDMPASKRRWIMTAIGGSGSKERREATARLAGAGEFSAVMVVLDRIKSGKELAEYFAIIMTSTRNRNPSDELDEFHFQLLRLAIAETNVQDSARMTRHVLRDTAVRRRATTTPWIQRLIELITDCNDTTRRTLIDGIYFDSVTIRKIVDSDLLHQWINAVAIEPDRAIRLRHIAKVLSSSTLMNAFGSGHVSVPIDIEELFKSLTPDGKNAFVDSTSNVPQALLALHKQLGDGPLLNAVSATADPATQGNLLGRIASLESWPKEKDKKRGVLDLIDQQAEGVTKHQVVIGYLEGLGKREKSGGAASKEIADSLWLMLHTENEEPWQLTALLETYMSPKTFDERHGNDTIDRMIRLTHRADSATAQLYAYAPLSRPHFAKQLSEHKRSLDFVRSVGNLPPSTSVNSRYRSLLTSTNFTNTIDTKEARLELLEICRDKIAIVPRYYAASGVLSNKTLLRQLLAERQYEKINECLIDSQDRMRLPSIVATFLVNQATIDFLKKEKRIHEVLDFQRERQFSDSEQFSVLYRFVSSDALVTSLLEAGHYDALLSMIGNIEGKTQRSQLQSQLTQRKAYVKSLAKKGKLRMRLQELFADKTWISRRGYNSLITNLSLDDVSKDPEIVLAFWEFTKKLEREHDRRECIRALISSKWFLLQLHKQGRLDEVISAIPNLVESKYFLSTLQSTFRSPNIVYFFENGHLNPLLKLSDSLNAEDQRKLFHYIGYSSHMQKWIKEEEQPKKFFAALGTIENMEMRVRFATGIFSSGLLSHKAGKEMDAELRQFLKGFPETSAAAIWISLLSRYETSKLITESDLAQKLVKYFDRDDVPPHLILQVAASAYGAGLLRDNKKSRRLIDLGLAIKDPKQLATIKRTFASSTAFQSDLTDEELTEIFLGWTKETNKLQLATTLGNSTSLISRLVSLGHLDALSEMVNVQPNNNSPYASAKWRFYTNPKVVETLRGRKQDADALADLLKQVRGGYSYSRASMLANSPAAVDWLLSTKGWKPIGDFISRATEREALQIVKALASREPFVIAASKNDCVDELIKLVDGENEALRQQLIKWSKAERESREK